MLCRDVGLPRLTPLLRGLPRLTQKQCKHAKSPFRLLRRGKPASLQLSQNKRGQLSTVPYVEKALIETGQAHVSTTVAEQKGAITHCSPCRKGTH
jgi:hypothetical protein